MTRVVLVVLDAMPHRHVGRSVTPVLWSLAGEGGMAPGGGRAVLATATYPNHATFATGAAPGGHGIDANVVLHEGRLVPAPDVGPACPTLFDACRAAGRSSALVVGDQYLVGVMGGRRADTHWPRDGVLRAGTPVDAHGYATDEAVLDALLPVVDRGYDLVFAHLNEPDTVAHDHGPDSPEALECYHATDGVLGRLVDALAPRWGETVLIVLSDHDQATVTDPEPVDIGAAARGDGADVVYVPEGSAAVLHGDTGDEVRRWLTAVPGVDEVLQLSATSLLASAAPGRYFGTAEAPGTLRGVHGGMGTCTQVAVVAGGHPVVSRLGGILATSEPPATSWAPLAASLLGMRAPGSPRGGR